MDVSVAPQLSVPTADDAIALVNGWLHREIGMALHVAEATFDPATFYWHLPVELAWGRLAMYMCRQRRGRSPVVPQQRNFGSAPKPWPPLMESSDAHLVRSGTAVLLRRSLCANGAQRSWAYQCRSSSAPPALSHAIRNSPDRSALSSYKSRGDFTIP